MEQKQQRQELLMLAKSRGSRFGEGDLNMKKKLVITILGLICFCMSGCVATTNSNGDKKSETSSDVKTEEKKEPETIIYDNEVNGEDEYYENETEYDEEIDEELEEEYFEDLSE